MFTSRFVPLTLLVALAVGFGACAPHQRLSPEDRRAIRGVSVVKRSQYPKQEEVFIYTFGQNMAGALGGVIGAAAAAASTGDDRSEFRAKLQRDAIDPGLIVAQEFESRLRASKVFPVVPPPADADFRFTVKNVGLGIPHGFATGLKPMLVAEGTLVRRGGAVVWRRTANVVPARGEYDRHPWDEYMGQPALLRTAIAQAAQLLADDFIADLGGQRAETAEEAEERREEEADRLRDEEEERQAQAKRAERARLKAERQQARSAR